VTVVIAGGSGFLGRKLTNLLEGAGHVVRVVTRRPAGKRDINWNPDGSPGSLSRDLESIDVVINLAGENVAGGRWTAQRKAALRSSRIRSTQTLVRAIAQCAAPPKLFVSSSAVGYYGSRGKEPLTESSSPGTDFLAALCVEWEEEARKAQSSSTRVAIVRTGLPLDAGGGVLGKMLLPFKLGLGATLGSGDQFMPWIHVDDWTAMIAWLIQNDRASGAFNASAPVPVTNRDFTRTLGRVLKRPAILHAPAFALHAVLGEMASALTAGQRALPACAEHLGFRFTYRTLEPALRSLL
jgi:uncharacterized protein (TIGR01777 family)